MPDSIDIRKESSINVVDFYTMSGRHLGSKATTEDGRIVWEDGRQPGKDMCFLDLSECPWLKDKTPWWKKLFRRKAARMTELERYKSAVQKYRFLVHLWLDEDCGCTCGQCEEMILKADELLDGKVKAEND